MSSRDISLVFFPVLMLILTLAVALVIGRWAWVDARMRGKSPLLVCILVVCVFPLGLLTWLIFRPDVYLRPQARPAGPQTRPRLS